METVERELREKERAALLAQQKRKGVIKTLQEEQLALKQQALAIEMQHEREHFAKIVRYVHLTSTGYTGCHKSRRHKGVF